MVRISVSPWFIVCVVILEVGYYVEPDTIRCLFMFFEKLLIGLKYYNLCSVNMCLVTSKDKNRYYLNF